MSKIHSAKDRSKPFFVMPHPIADLPSSFYFDTVEEARDKAKELRRGRWSGRGVSVTAYIKNGCCPFCGTAAPDVPLEDYRTSKGGYSGTCPGCGCEVDHFSLWAGSQPTFKEEY
jgi:hypothetical protein